MKLVITILTFIASYYMGVLLHEWGHGTVAWLFGYKASPFEVDYGGWFLLQTDEHVPYDLILAARQGLRAALIGIAGVSVNIGLYVLSWISLSKIKHSFLIYSFFYWFAVVNMVPIFQYLTVQTFSAQGDVGRFTHGLNISPWWVFVPGTAFLSIALYHFFRHLVPKAYAILFINSLWIRRVFLLATLGVIFLWIYLGGYNPLSDPGMPPAGKIFAIFTLLLVPILFFLCSPSNSWVKREIDRHAKGNSRYPKG